MNRVEIWTFALHIETKLPTIGSAALRACANIFNCNSVITVFSDWYEPLKTKGDGSDHRPHTCRSADQM